MHSCTPHYISAEHHTAVMSAFSFGHAHSAYSSAMRAHCMGQLRKAAVLPDMNILREVDVLSVLSHVV